MILPHYILKKETHKCFFNPEKIISKTSITDAWNLLDVTDHVESEECEEELSPGRWHG